MSDEKKTVLFWVDLETTGLDERHGVGEILEYAIVVTDLQLNEMGSKEAVIAHEMAWIEDCMSPEVKEMHTKNGLLDEIRKISDVPNKPWGIGAVAIEEQEILYFLRQFAADDVIFVIAGSSISFDRRWIKAWMPTLESKLHYRQLDVSVYKVGFPQIFGAATSEAHRAMADIRESIKKHRLMREIVDAATKFAVPPFDFSVS